MVKFILEFTKQSISMVVTYYGKARKAFSFLFFLILYMSLCPEHLFALHSEYQRIKQYNHLKTPTTPMANNCRKYYNITIELNQQYTILTLSARDHIQGWSRKFRELSFLRFERHVLNFDTFNGHLFEFKWCIFQFENFSNSREFHVENGDENLDNSRLATLITKASRT